MTWNRTFICTHIRRERGNCSGNVCMRTDNYYSKIDIKELLDNPSESQQING
jgi:hypothetical protein